MKKIIFILFFVFLLMPFLTMEIQAKVICNCVQKTSNTKSNGIDCTSCDPSGCGLSGEGWTCKAVGASGTAGDSTTRLANPLGNNVDIPIIANRIISAALGLTGILAIVAFIWGGIEWMTSGGNQQRIQKGKTMMIWAVIGLVVIFGSYAIITFIFQALGAGPTTTTGASS